MYLLELKTIVFLPALQFLIDIHQDLVLDVPFLPRNPVLRPTLMLPLSLNHEFDKLALPLLENGIALGGNQIAHGMWYAFFVEL
jgi:hypothetical protein